MMKNKLQSHKSVANRLATHRTKRVHQWEHCCQAISHGQPFLMEMEHSPGRYGRDRRLATQWEFQSRCTWSHSINDGSVGGGEATGPENVSCLHCDKGPSIFDVRHNVTVNAVVPYYAS